MVSMIACMVSVLVGLPTALNAAPISMLAMDDAEFPVAVGDEVAMAPGSATAPGDSNVGAPEIDMDADDDNMNTAEATDADEQPAVNTASLGRAAVRMLQVRKQAQEAAKASEDAAPSPKKTKASKAAVTPVPDICLQPGPSGHPSCFFDKDGVKMDCDVTDCKSALSSETAKNMGWTYEGQQYRCASADPSDTKGSIAFGDLCGCPKDNPLIVPSSDFMVDGDLRLVSEQSVKFQRCKCVAGYEMVNGVCKAVVEKEDAPDAGTKEKGKTEDQRKKEEKGKKEDKDVKEDKAAAEDKKPEAKEGRKPSEKATAEAPKDKIQEKESASTQKKEDVQEKVESEQHSVVQEDQIDDEESETSLFEDEDSTEVEEATDREQDSHDEDEPAADAKKAAELMQGRTKKGRSRSKAAYARPGEYAAIASIKKVAPLLCFEPLSSSKLRAIEAMIGRLDFRNEPKVLCPAGVGGIRPKSMVDDMMLTDGEQSLDNSVAGMVPDMAPIYNDPTRHTKYAMNSVSQLVQVDKDKKSTKKKAQKVQKKKPPKPLKKDTLEVLERVFKEFASRDFQCSTSQVDMSSIVGMAAKLILSGKDLCYGEFIGELVPTTAFDQIARRINKLMTTIDLDIKPLESATGGADDMPEDMATPFVPDCDEVAERGTAVVIKGKRKGDGKAGVSVPEIEKGPALELPKMGAKGVETTWDKSDAMARVMAKPPAPSR